MAPSMNRVRGLELAVMTACIAACGGADKTTNVQTSNSPSLKLSAITLSDTIGSLVASPLVVTVRNATGAPALNESVTVRAFFVSPVTGPQFTRAATLTAFPFGGNETLTAPTDDAGHVNVTVLLGSGAAAIRIVASSRFGSDSIDGRVMAGRPSYFTISRRDTTLYVGGAITPTIAASDRAGNAIPDAFTLTARRPSVLDAVGGTLTARAIGRGVVVASVGDLRDSVMVSVVPSGTLVAARGDGTAVNAGSFFVFNLDGSNYQSFSNGVSTAFQPNHAPRWNSVLGRVFYHDVYPPSQGNGDALYSVPLGGAPTELVTPAAISGDRFASVGYPTVTADGSTMYFAATTTFNETSIWQARSNGAGVVRIGPSTLPNEYDTQPTVSPDGRRLAYITNRGNQGSAPQRLLVFDLGSGTSVSLAVLGTHPSWSPTGDEIAYFANGVSVIKPDGTDETVIAAGDFDQSSEIAWSPDGKWLVTCRQSFPMVLINRATGEQLPLAFTLRDKLCEANWKS
jgi:hypothetical protein